MYVSAMRACLFGGRSTPAIRAMVCLSVGAPGILSGSNGYRYAAGLVSASSGFIARLDFGELARWGRVEEQTRESRCEIRFAFPEIRVFRLSNLTSLIYPWRCL